MATISKFEDLEIWKLARDFTNEIFQTYSSSDLFHKDYALRDQVNKSSGSIMDNIAEGFGRGGRNEFVNFLSIAKGSAEETKSQLYRAFDRKYLSQEKFDFLYNLGEQLCKKIGAFMNYLNSSTHKGSKFKNRIPGKDPKLQTPNT